MRHAAIAALALAACGNLTDETAPIGACAESTKEWWPVRTGASWVYRVTDRLAIATNPVAGLPPDVAWKEQRIMGVDVEIGGLAGHERGIRMRSIDELDAEWDYSHFVERDSSYRWVSKLLYSELEFPPRFPLQDGEPDQERFYAPPRARLDYSAEHLCVGNRWHEEWEASKYTLFDEPPLPEQTKPDDRPCLLSTWIEEGPWACDPATEREGSTWTVVAADATVSLFGGRRFYEHALCLKRLDDDFQNDALYCWVRGVGKVLECEVDHFSRDVIKIEELCLHCPDGEDCEWTPELGGREGVPPPPLCNELCLPCPAGEDCDWTEASGLPPPDCALEDNWQTATCDDALL